MKIAIIAISNNSIAVWNSLKLHVMLLKQCGYTTDIYYPSSQEVDIIQTDVAKEVKFYDSWWSLRRELKHNDYDYIFCIGVTDVLYIKMMFLRKSRIVHWVQGAVAEESYMRHKSKIRYWVLLFLEKLAFYFDDRYVFVSSSMKEFYSMKYTLRGESIVIPCVSEFEGNTNIIDNRRIPNSFVYIGGLSEWQCFPYILMLYNKIRTPDSVFHIITLDVDKANSLVDQILLDKKGVKIYAERNRERIPAILSQFEYGFLIRQNSPVNYVASPIKFAEYLSCGVNVILTSALPTCVEIVNKYSVGTVVNIDDADIKLSPYSDKAYQAYKDNFDRNLFVQRYKSLLE